MERITKITDVGLPVIVGDKSLYPVECYDCCIDNKVAKKLLKDAILKLAKYEELGTVEECRRAMEKQKAKRAIDDTAFGMCPNCHSEFNSELISEYDMKHCIYCGQAIDWRESL